MPLPGIDDQVVLGPVPAQGAVEVDRLGERHVGVVLAAHDQHRRADLRGERDRADPVVRVRAGTLPAEAAGQYAVHRPVFAGAGDHAQSEIPAFISAALNRSVCPTAQAVMNPPWLGPVIPSRSGSATPAATSMSIPSRMSLHSAPPRSPTTAAENSRPCPVPPRGLGRN